jgi:hypothetical protein
VPSFWFFLKKESLCFRTGNCAHTHKHKSWL